MAFSRRCRGSPVPVIVPPIKSQGIKTRLVPWIQSLVPGAKGRWVEPFLGTGVVAFNCGFPRAVLGDANPHVIRFYRQVQQGVICPDRVRTYLEAEGANLRAAGGPHYNRIRDRFNRTHDPLDFLFLSRAGFNGMMRFNRRGEWNIPFCKNPNRFSKAYITKIVNQVGRAAGAIAPDWRFLHALFAQVIDMAGPEDVIYCDPPYFGRYADYYSGWTEADEQRLFDALSATRARFLLSTWHHNAYRENDMVKRYWSRFHIATRDHFYHAGAKMQNRNAVVEALVCNFEPDPGHRAEEGRVSEAG